MSSRRSPRGHRTEFVHETQHLVSRGGVAPSDEAVNADFLIKVNTDDAEVSGVARIQVVTSGKQAAPVNVVDRVLTPEEAERLLAACDAARYPYLKPMISVLLNTLMRVSETLSLRWEQVDFLTGRITLVRTKNGKAREIDMNPIIREVLSTLKRWNGNHPYVFPHHHKADAPRVNPDYDALHDACHKAGIGAIGFHTFRHTGASWLMAAGVDIETVRVMGGWSDYKILMRYCHTTREQKQKAAGVLASLLKGANSVASGQNLAKIQKPTIEQNPQAVYNQPHASVAQW